MRKHSLRFGALALENLRELGYQVTPIDRQKHKGTDAGCAAALAGAVEMACDQQGRRMRDLADSVARKHRDLADEHDPELAAKYAAEAKELADLRAELS